jgi:hypothetical protein
MTAGVRASRRPAEEETMDQDGQVAAGDTAPVGRSARVLPKEVVACHGHLMERAVRSRR